MMIRRIAALIGIALLLATLILLIWTVHMHRQRTMNGNGTEITSMERVGKAQSAVGSDGDLHARCLFVLRSAHCALHTALCALRTAH